MMALQNILCTQIVKVYLVFTWKSRYIHNFQSQCMEDLVPAQSEFNIFPGELARTGNAPVQGK